MKRLALLITLMIIGPSWAVDVEVNGQRLPASPAPILESGRVLVPMRAVFAALGAEVDYRNGTITAHRDGDTIVLRPGSSQATVNGQSVTLDSAAKLTQGTTYVPLRFVAQALGETVAWHASDKLVVVGQSMGGSVGQALGQKVSQVFAAPTALQRLVVGNQGGVLKVWDKSMKEVAYYRGLDDRSVAPLSAQDQQQILTLLGISGMVDGAAQQVMSSYSNLPAKQALALLGVFNSLDGSSQISPATASQVRSFLVNRMKSDKAVEARRQAVLALAVGNGLDDVTTQAVLDFYSGSENLWETFPVQQFFEYQADRLKTSPEFAQIKAQALSVDSLYRQNIMAYLGG